MIHNLNVKSVELNQAKRLLEYTTNLNMSEQNIVESICLIIKKIDEIEKNMEVFNDNKQES